MSLKSLLLSSDEKTVRVLRRVLSDLEIEVELCSGADAAIRKLTRQRFDAIIVDCSKREEASSVLRGAQAAPVNKRALSIALVESTVGLRGGFEMGAHFVLYKPLSGERARASFRAIRALMNRERRLQLRVAVQIPVICNGSDKYKARTVNLCEGGMAIHYDGTLAKETFVRFSLQLPGLSQRLDLYGELAWEDSRNQAGVRFTNLKEEQRTILREWLNCQLPEPEQEDPPVSCSLTELSQGGCYLRTESPFPRGTNVILSVKSAGHEGHAYAIVRVAHPEFGMGVEFILATSEQREQAQQMIETLRSHQSRAHEIQVAPEGLETSSMDRSGTSETGSGDALVDLFRRKAHAPVDVFLQQMEQQRQTLESR